ncbi:hypothetical protein [Mediterraneibacter glycyrrhizinilyticus]|uniref:hypothetical protein n=1 Tax=Mediterraneibacter glycyrrhizinilyticus TaxID=342942 RepID=UPI0025A403A2|nr:hypothetical protein [Mediterraneibacter glycyrrhizinilyticus]MDM8126748.1 hypothetical protein [Mediterraneibacter glycyrrhizinilyticus]
MIEAKNSTLKELELQGNEETKEAIGILDQAVRENKLMDGLAKALLKEIRMYDEYHVEIKWNFSEDVVKFILDT